MKTFIYLCRSGDNEELRYSLRSVNKFYPDAAVWVVGGKPKWYSGNYIEVKQEVDSFKNIKKALYQIVNSNEIPNDIIIMNDDFFFVRHVENILFYISGTLEDRIAYNQKNGVNSSYIKRLIDLNEHCKIYKDNPLDFDLHVPIPVNKKDLSSILKNKVMWRSDYGNKFATDDMIEVIEDVKVYPKGLYNFKSYDYADLKYPFISTDDYSFHLVCRYLLKDLFPDPSKYEL